MRVLLIADRSFASREHLLLRRLEIGLIDEGARIVRLHPEGCFNEPAAGLAAELTYPDGFWRRYALSPSRDVLRALDDAGCLADADRAPFDVIHAWGEGCWPLASELAASLGADLVLEVPSRAALQRVRRAEDRARALARAGASGLWLAPDEAMREAVSSAARRWPVALAPWGVHAPRTDPHADAARSSNPVASLCIITGGRDHAAVAPLLEALAASPAASELLIFLDSAGPALWRHARALGLLPRLSIIADMESRRELVLQADALAQPDAAGEHRSLLLHAMAAGVIVLARADPLVAITSDERTAVVARGGTPQDWAAALAILLEQPAEARARAAAARAFITEHRPVHSHIRATLDAYDLARKGRPMHIAPASPANR